MRMPKIELSRNQIRNADVFAQELQLAISHPRTCRNIVNIPLDRRLFVGLRLKRHGDIRLFLVLPRGKGINSTPKLFLVPFDNKRFRRVGVPHHRTIIPHVDSAVEHPRPPLECRARCPNLYGGRTAAENTRAKIDGTRAVPITRQYGLAILERHGLADLRRHYAAYRVRETFLVCPAVETPAVRKYGLGHVDGFVGAYGRNSLLHDIRTGDIGFGFTDSLRSEPRPAQRFDPSGDADEQKRGGSNGHGGELEQPIPLRPPGSPVRSRGARPLLDQHELSARRLAQKIRRLERRGGTRLRLRRAHEREHMRHRRRDLWAHRPHVGERLALDRLREQLHRRAALVRALPRQHLVEHHAQCVDVRPRVDVVRVHHLLRRHVGRRADDHARRRHRRLVRLVRELRDAQVRQLRRPVRVEHDVLGLDVAVDNPVPVRHLQRERDLRSDAHRLGHRERAAPLEAVRHAPARHVVHDDVAQARLGVLPHVVHGDQVLVADGHRELRLAREPLAVVGPLLHHLREHHLHRVPLAARRAHEVHRAHAALPEQLLHGVVAEHVARFEQLSGGLAFFSALHGLKYIISQPQKSHPCPRQLW